MKEMIFIEDFDKFEKEKICNLLQCTSSDLDNLIQSSYAVFKNSDNIYDAVMKILQQGHNVREATLISLLCGKYFGFDRAQEKIEEDIKQKLFDAFNNKRS